MEPSEFNKLPTLNALFTFLPYNCSSDSNNILNKSSESGYTCLVPNLKVKDFSCSLLSVMLTVGL